MSDTTRRQPVREFDSTRWSLVLDASENGGRALAELCEVYWPSIYSFARRKGWNSQDAEDLTQGFFVHLLEANSVAAADPTRGKFRSFLLTSFRNFMANQWDRRRTLKRGGRSTILPLDFERGEQRYQRSSVGLSADELFDRQWVAALLDRVLDRLRADYDAAGKLSIYSVLKVFLAGKNADMTFRKAANQLGISESAAISAASRMRRRYRELIVSEIADTVATPEGIDEEIRSLFRSLA